MKGGRRRTGTRREREGKGHSHAEGRARGRGTGTRTGGGAPRAWRAAQSCWSRAGPRRGPRPVRACAFAHLRTAAAVGILSITAPPTASHRALGVVGGGGGVTDRLRHGGLARTVLRIAGGRVVVALRRHGLRVPCLAVVEAEGVLLYGAARLLPRQPGPRETTADPPYMAITHPALRAHCQLYDLRGVPAQQHHQQRHSHPALWGMQALPAVSSTRRQAGTRTGGFHTLPRLLSRPLTVRQPPEARTAEPQRRAPTACARCGGALSLGLCPFVFCRGSQAALDRAHRSDR